MPKQQWSMRRLSPQTFSEQLSLVHCRLMQAKNQAEEEKLLRMLERYVQQMIDRHHAR